MTDKKLILIVEDEMVLAKTMEERFKDEGFEVVLAHNGLDGFQTAINLHPDIILLDLLMPVLDGVSMLGKLREDKWGSTVKVMILSNLSDPKSLLTGADKEMKYVSNYFVKTDLSLDELIVKINTELNIKI